jgi:hypothetical protein
MCTDVLRSPGPDRGKATDKYDAFPRGDTAPTPRIAKWKADNGGAPTAAVAEKLKPAHPTAPMAYTGGAHQMINSVGRSRLLPEGYAPYGLGSLACAGAEAISLRQIKKQLRRAAQDPGHELAPTLDQDPVIGPQLAAARGTDPVAKKAAPSTSTSGRRRCDARGRGGRVPPGRRGGGGNPHTWARAPLRAAFLAGNNGDAAG